MFTPTSMRSVNAYTNLAAETSVAQANQHQLVDLLFDALLQSLVAAKGAMLNKDIPLKGRSITRAVRLLDEGLKAGLDFERGGELAQNLGGLYDYCMLRLTEANLRNDVGMVEEVVALIRPVAESWKQIGAAVPQAKAA